jgi:hypothetical protein
MPFETVAGPRPGWSDEAGWGMAARRTPGDRGSNVATRGHCRPLASGLKKHDDQAFRPGHLVVGKGVDLVTFRFQASPSALVRPSGTSFARPAGEHRHRKADSPLVNSDLVRQLVLAAAVVIFVGAVITGTWLTAIAMVFTAIGMASSLWSTRTRR